jgi:hypothetical protein
MIDIGTAVSYKAATLITGVTGKRSFSGAFLAFQPCNPENPTMKGVTSQLSS